MEFNLPDELVELQGLARRFADRVLKPTYVERDIAGEFSWDLLKQLADAGFLGLNVPVDAGGQGAGDLAAGVVAEELAYADSPIASMVLGVGTGCKILHKHASPEIKEEWLPRVLGGETTISLGITEPEAGSDISGVRTSAILKDDRWILRGEKSSVSFPEAKCMIVLARAEDGFALFFVPNGTPGLQWSIYRDMGRNAHGGRGVVTFDDVEIPKSYRLSEMGTGLRDFLDPIARSKVIVCLMDIGTARASLDDAIAWAKDRVTFGAPLASRQGVAFPLADHYSIMEMGRLWCYRTLWLADQGASIKVESAIAKSLIPAQMMQACHDSMLVLGHVAYAREHPAQVRIRDVIGTEIGEGPANTQRIVISRHLFGATPS